ncbi:uncharacterized protein SPPG_00259 [Spizellomyces punctatus DAOM BR117]|uniref:Protein farnesyltransferase subunit beta n=2 Tax=Spizellomyces punctatus (strain DAOM BR117) TaxID=645134 RepID=A0A0L0HTU9_SPIPD|nr:uncharacterized protein SPPG_00259 [Spizellomyces punctatus DAOM BR117]KND04533.1 hypothetical protein SPPG_00259 [Spizellomyces punctatus DAOM BR117]|eukprot:XP_016612572.1 hypothetical protein SPPG_00259 [Spizellomyces punctatus DAOM BR117]
MRIVFQEEPDTQADSDTSDQWLDEDIWGLPDDGFPTETSEMQEEVEAAVMPLYARYKWKVPPEPLTSVRLQRTLHIRYLKSGLEGLSKRFVVLDASQPWLVYWMLHGLDLLDEPLSQEVASRAVKTLARCQNSTGGFGGGPGQISHVATTYAAVNALAIVGTQEAYDLIDRSALLDWLRRLKQADGSFLMHEGGELDVRGIYCVLATVKLLNIVSPDLAANSEQFIACSQTYEGGIGGIPGVEAHGGYTFCAFAAMELLGKTELLDLDKLSRWLCFRQLAVEKGFQGRTNKLVDGCYSFWQGGAFPLLECALARRDGDEAGKVDLFNREALQEYILICCQGERGGLKDKPDKNPDYYHTCYVLSGLSIAQHRYAWDPVQEDIIVADGERGPVVVGNGQNLLPATHPVHNILPRHVTRIRAHFAQELPDA